MARKPLPSHHPSQFNVALGSREWYNHNRGGASVVEASSVEEGGGGGAGGDPVVMLTVFTGPLAAPLVPGQRLKLSWRLLLTPVRGAGGPPVADFGTRYFHMQRHEPYT